MSEIELFLKKHPMLTDSAAIKSLCEPLQALDITYFVHAQVDKNKRLAAVSTDPEFVELYFRRGYYQCDIHMLEPPSDESYIIWDLVKRCGKSKTMHEEFMAYNYGHTFSIIFKRKAVMDVFHFATNLDNHSINQQYLQNLDNLKKFAAHFKLIASQDNKLKLAYDKKVALSTDKGSYFTEEPVFSRKITLLLDEQLSNKCQLLTQREKECLNLWLKGFSAKEIESILNISYRTVQKHIEKIKKKVGSGNRSELIEILKF